ncbi:MAG TPA: hypothetical protein PK878_05700 [bacterium]|nr:hypothetical protein [bacterium]
MSWTRRRFCPALRYPMIHENDTPRIPRYNRKRPERALCILGLCLAGLVSGWTAAESTGLPDLLAVQVPPYPDPQTIQERHYPPAGRYVDGCQIVRLACVAGRMEIVPLTHDFLSACDPAVSFDGQSILFAGKRRAGDTWQIWRMDRDGGNPIQLTQSPSDCVSPLFVGALFHLNDVQPTLQIIYVNHEPDGRCGSGPSLYALDGDGQNPKRITFNPGGGFDPDVLPTGRIVFSSWNHPIFDPGKPGLMGLLVVSNDGTDLMPYYGMHEPPTFKTMVRVSFYDDRVYFIESNDSPWLGGGDIAYVSRRRPLCTYTVLSPGGPGVYHSPCPLPDGGLLASFREDREDSLFRIFRVSPKTGERLEEIASLANSHLLDTQVLAPHPPVKGRSTVVNLQKDTGVFYGLNVYCSNRPGAELLAPGSIKRIRVIEGLPGRSSSVIPLGPLMGNSTGPETSNPAILRRIVGIAPVEADGSFHIEVPAQIPLTFQLLDETGMARMSQNVWTWVMPNEKRGCIGCHEDRELAPPNKMVQAVTKPAVRLTLPPERRRTVDFLQDLQPLIQMKCSGTACHSPGGAPPQLDVDTLISKRPGDIPISAAYDTLLSPIPGRNGEHYVIPGQARESALIWHLMGAKPDNPTPNAPYTSRVTLMPPEQPLAEVERTLFIEWIDLGALWNSRLPASRGSSPASNASDEDGRKK